MPVVLRISGYRFGFYASDRDEPRHIHVRRENCSAKFWLEPAIALEYNRGFKPHELTEIERLVTENRDFLQEAWDVFFGN